MNKHYDIIIVGGGPAGLTAAIYARRAGKSVLVLEKAAVGGHVYNDTVKDHAIVGDFFSAFKWGFSKEIPLEIIKYGDPDNTGKDLKGYNQVYIRAEVYLGWGILVPEYFARVVDET